MDERLDQIVVDLLEAVICEAQQVQSRGRRRHPSQFVDGVKLHQRGLVSHAIVRQAGRGEESPGKIIERLEESPPLTLLPEFLVAEILGFVFQYRELVEALIGFEQGL